MLSPRYLITALLVGLLPALTALADPMREAAAQGEALGTGQLSELDGVLEFDEDAGGWHQTIRNADGTERTDFIHARELRGGAELDDWKSGQLADLHERNIDQVEASGRQAQQELEEGDSPYADAYRTSRTRNTVAADELLDDQELWGQTDQARSGVANMVDQFGGCRISHEHETARVIDSHTVRPLSCEVLHARPGCVKHRHVETATMVLDTIANVQERDLLEPITRTFSIVDHLPAGFDMVDAVTELDWYGTVADVQLDPPWIGNDWEITIDVLLDEEQFVCEGTCTVNDPGCICERDGVQQNVYAFTTVTVTGLSATINTYPEGCMDTNDGFCQANWRCYDDAPRVVNGVSIGPHNTMGMPRLYPFEPQNQPPNSEDPFCWQAVAEYDCPFNIGSAGCWVTTGDIEVCHENIEGEVLQPTPELEASTCPILIQGDRCRQVGRRCAENAKGPDDHCYVESVTYECWDHQESEDITRIDTFDCGEEGSMRCLGDDCLPTTSQARHSTPVSQVETRARMKAMQHLFTGYSHIDETGTDVWIFAGIPYQCRKSLGGPIDLCNIHPSGWIQSYWNWIDKIARIDAGISTIYNAHTSDEQPMESSAGALRNPANHRWDVVGNRPLVNIEEIVTDGIGLAEYVADARDQIAQGRDGTGGMGYEIANYLYGSPGGYPTPFSLHRARTAWEMYLRESAVPRDFPGTEDEYILHHFRGYGACMHIGGACHANDDHPLNACTEYIDTYCCYDSHVARIMQENRFSISGLDRPDPGEPSAPLCSGFMSMPDGEGLDNLPLQEIIGWEAYAGAAFKTDDIDERTNESRITGYRSLQGPTGRNSISRRLQKRLQDIDMDAVNRTVRNELTAQLPDEVQEPPSSVGELTLGSLIVSGSPGGRVRIPVQRTGDQGPASVTVRVGQWNRPGVYSAVEFADTLHWEAGDGTSKHVVVELPPVAASVPTFHVEAKITLQGATGAPIAQGRGEGRLKVSHRRR